MVKSIIKINNIIELTLSDNAKTYIERICIKLPKEAIPLKPQDLHVTLWKLTKEERKLLKTLAIPTNIPQISPIEPIICVNRPEYELNGKFIPARTAWIVKVTQKEKLRQLVDELAQSVGLKLSEYECRRLFHISIANLSGSPYDSIGDVSDNDV
jgi:hypothetical protein